MVVRQMPETLHPQDPEIENNSHDFDTDSPQRYAKSPKETVPQILDGDGAPGILQDLQDGPGPVGPVAQLAQVRQRLLRGPHDAFAFRQLVTCNQMRNIFISQIGILYILERNENS